MKIRQSKCEQLTTHCHCQEEDRKVLHDKCLELHVISSNLIHTHSEISSFSSIWPFVTSLHLRKQDVAAEEMEQIIHCLQNLRVPMEKLTLNRQLELAHKYNTGALHIGMREVESFTKSLSSFKRKSLQTGSNEQFIRLGVSVHSHEEARYAEKKGADYVFYGHIYSSASKPGLAPRGLCSLRELCEGVSLPVIAVGGITPERVKEVIGAGASGIAVISGVLQSQDPLSAALRYRQELRNLGELR